MSASDWIGLGWIACGIPGGIAFAWSNRHLDERSIDRAMTAIWSVGICVLCGPLSLPALFDHPLAEEAS